MDRFWSAFETRMDAFETLLERKWNRATGAARRGIGMWACLCMRIE